MDPARSLVARGMGERLWDSAIAPRLDEYVSRPAFERACRQWVWRALAAGELPGALADALVEVGYWWGGGDQEIDVVCLDVSSRAVLVGESK